MDFSQTHTPVIIGNCAPFRLVLREGDTWLPELEEINNLSYDYVKLCRLSCFIDIGIAPYSLGISFDGTLILPAAIEYKSREAAIDIFNEALGLLLLGGVYSEAVSPTDISYGKLFFDGYLSQSGGGMGFNAVFHHAIQTKHIGALQSFSLYRPRTLTVAELELAYIKGREYFKKLNLLTPSLLLNGISNYVKHQWVESLIFLWTSIEQVINLIWMKEIINGKSPDTPIEGRSKFLKDFRTWTTSTKIELLFQKKIIGSKDYRLLNVARKSRNDFIHNGKTVSELNVKSALISLFHLMSLVITDYENVSELNQTLELIYSNQRGDLFPKETDSKLKVSHWLAIPPIPGDPKWGTKSYEIIEELVLKPLQTGL